MIRLSWINNQICDKYASTLEEINSYDFCKIFRISQQGNIRNKTFRHVKENFTAIFYLLRNSYEDSDKYWKYCKYSLMKFKLWIREKIQHTEKIKLVRKKLLYHDISI